MLVKLKMNNFVKLAFKDYFQSLLSVVTGMYHCKCVMNFISVNERLRSSQLESLLSSHRGKVLKRNTGVMNIPPGFLRAAELQTKKQNKNIHCAIKGLTNSN